MKGAKVIVWLFVVIAAYILTSGPATHLKRTAVWPALDLLYRPLSYACSYTPLWRILVPYWNFWIYPDDNPLYFG